MGTIRNALIRLGLVRDQFTILFVCKANITRSAYFEGYMKHYLALHLPHIARKICVRSAGVQARGGSPASRVVQHVAHRDGFSLSGHYSSPLSRKWIERADAILVMESGQKEAIHQYLPEARGKTFLVTEYLRNDDEDLIADIPDPTGQNAPEYKTFIDVAHAEVERICRELMREDII